MAAIALGGALGGPARYGAGLLLPTGDGAFPAATALINISGSFALGALLVFVIERWPPTRYVRPFVAIGFLGSYTTFSTFAVETVLLVQRLHFISAAASVAVNMIGGLGACLAGIVLARMLPTVAHRR